MSNPISSNPAAGAPSLRARLAYTLLFLFPVGGFVVPHWLSGFFLLLALSALAGPWFSWAQLKVAEKGVLILCLAYFAAFLLSGLINGAEAALVKRLGVELRYLFVVPLYLVARNLPQSAQWLLRGCALGGWVFAGNAVYEFFVLGSSVVAGAYHHILYGATAAVYAILLWNRWWSRTETGPWQWVYLSGALTAGLTVVLSGSRTAYVVLLAVALLWGVLHFRRRNFAWVVLAVTGLALASYAVSERVAERVDRAVAEVAYYFKLEDPAREKQELPSAALRLEMWRTALLIIRGHPWFGVAREGYSGAAARYVEQGRVHWQAPQQGQPHNAYLEVLVSFGIVGFIPFAGMLLLPLAAVWRRALRADGASAALVLFLACYATTALAAGAPFLRGNAVALFVVLLAVLMSDAMRGAAAEERQSDA